MRPARLARLIIVGLVGAAGLAGCSSSTEPQAVDFVGTYTLQTINGQRMPYVALQSGVNELVITGETLTIAEGGTWIETVGLQVITNGQAVGQAAGNQGTWIRSGTSLVLAESSDGAVIFNGAFSQGRLDFASGTAAYVFTK
jgi:hypothetical protein